MKPFKKVCKIGSENEYDWAKDIWVTIELREKDGKLSLAISGEVGPKRGGDADSCGQIRSELARVTAFAAGWDKIKVLQLSDIWRKWHLNNLNAGSPIQELTIKNFYEPHNGRFCHTQVEKLLKDYGVFEDESYLVDGKPYKYGSAWLHKDLPDSVLRWLKTVRSSAHSSHPWYYGK